MPPDKDFQQSTGGICGCDGFFDAGCPACTPDLAPTAPADSLLGGSARNAPRKLSYLPEAATAEQRERARSSALYQRGDMRLVWVNESDLAIMLLNREAVSYGRQD